MIDKIKQALDNIGLESIPKDTSLNLYSQGLDSLMAALLFSELESLFETNLNTSLFKKESFESIDTIALFIKEASK